jgi:hypothetical protein
VDIAADFSPHQMAVEQMLIAGSKGRGQNQCGGDAELGQCVFDGGLYKGIDYLLVFEFYFLFGRMNIYIDMSRIQVNK